MACERYEDALKQMAAGAAPSAEAPRLGAPRVELELESHLAGCSRCREELNALRRTLALVDSELHQLVAAEPSPELAARIRRAAAEDVAEPERRTAWLWPALAVAAALLLAVAFLARRGPSPTPIATAQSRVPRATATPEPPRHAPHERASAPVPPPPVASSRAVPRAHALSGDSRRTNPPAEPEVLVPPGEQAALLRLAALVTRQGGVPPVMASVNQDSPDLAVPRAIDAESIEIKPLEIVPLDPAETNGTTAEGEGR
jgi:hypothetical protein